MDFSPSKLLGKNSTFQASLHYLVYPVPFHGSSLLEQEKLCLPSTESLPTKTMVDILSPKPGVAYIFDPCEFDATKTDPKDRKKIKKKLLDSLIEKASHEGGQVLVSNGGDRWGRNQKFCYYTLVCNRIRKCHKKPTERLDTKNESLNNSRKKNSRVNGHKAEPKRTSTSLPLTKEEACKFQLKIKCNNRCFFYVPTKACVHVGHAYECKEDIVSKGKRLLNVEEEDSRKKMSRTKTSGGGTSSSIGMFRQHGVMFSRQYLKNKCRKDPISNLDGSMTKSQMMQTNDAESIRDHLITQHQCKVVIMRAKKSEEEQPTISLECSENNSAAPSTLPISTDDSKEVGSYLRTTVGRDRDQNLLALAFTSRAQYQLARSFSSTISIDSTHKTCQIDNLSLLTVTVKDAFGLTSVVLSFWIPNQRTWMFRYILLEVIPKLFGEDFCIKVRAIISDGDRQLIRSIELAIAKFYLHAVRLPCTWHIVCPPLKNGHRTIVRRPHISKYWLQWFLRLLQKWVYTFMKSNGGVETVALFTL